jgi:hypothetical protein
VEDAVHLIRHLEGHRDIVFDQGKFGGVLKVLEVSAMAGDEIVHSDHPMAIRQESVDQMGA